MIYIRFALAVLLVALCGSSILAQPKKDVELGPWVGPYPTPKSDDVTMTLRRIKDEWLMRWTLKDGSSFERKLVEKGNNRWNDLKEPGDYYLINKAGDLEVRDDCGLIYTMKRKR